MSRRASSDDESLLSEFLDRYENTPLRHEYRCAGSAPGSPLHSPPAAAGGALCMASALYGSPTSPSLTSTSTHDTGVRVVARVIDEAANAHAPHRATLETSLMSNPN